MQSNWFYAQLSFGMVSIVFLSIPVINFLSWNYLEVIAAFAFTKFVKEIDIQDEMVRKKFFEKVERKNHT